MTLANRSKILILFTVLGLALLAFVACGSNVGSRDEAGSLGDQATDHPIWSACCVLKSGNPPTYGSSRAM